MTRSMRFLWNRDAYISLFWLLIMQVIVALSTYLIATSMKYIESDLDTTYFYMMLFVVSLFLVYFPSAISSIYLEKWKVSAQKRFILGFASLNFGKRSLDRQKNKDEHEGWVTTESMLLYGEAPESIYSIFGTVLNTLLSIIIVSMILDISILLWYVLAIFLVVGIKILSKDKIAANAKLVQGKRNAVISVLSRMWVNTISGSPKTFQNWQQSYLKNTYVWKKKAAQNELFLMGVSSVSAMLALAFICAGNALYLMSLSSADAVAVFLVTLPRQVQIMQNTFMFFNHYLRWKGVAHKLSNLDQHLELKNEDTSQYINLEDISINGNQFNSIDEIKAYIQRQPYGRYTIQGKNGAGKSTLLRRLVEGDKYVFVPSAFRDLEFSNLRDNTSSDGESVRKLFDSLHHVKEIDTLYLDEWDASLDIYNKAHMHAEVRELAEKKRIIEVVHG
ncbi:ATP-binding cassette domain-containing protein [Marinomonas sp. PE14-40]|uniref:ATP-binding cassette domain-containing protein n=1 Tax=Marinomonas sp. PE14-40 TaxID=3060621 RepID=UPI003F67EB23